MEAILFAVMAATIICLVVHIWVTHKVNKAAYTQYKEQCLKIAERLIEESYFAGFKEGKNFKGEDLMLCKKCGHKLILGSTWITEIEPDAEPYEADIEEDMDIIDCDVCFNLHYCPKCKIIHDIWDDDKEHLIGK